jgi:hypothetical protein
MPTPSGPTISMDNMRDEITRSTGSVSMQEIRTRAGRSGAISFSQMYNCEGWVQTNAQYVSKYFTHEGWSTLVGPSSSISPNEGGSSPTPTGALIFTTTSPGSRLVAAFTVSGGANTTMSIANTGGSVSSTIATNYRAQDVTRVVFANTSRTILSQPSNNTVIVSYQQATSGTYHNMIQF